MKDILLNFGEIIVNFLVMGIINAFACFFLYREVASYSSVEDVSYNNIFGFLLIIAGACYRIKQFIKIDIDGRHVTIILREPNSK